MNLSTQILSATKYQFIKTTYTILLQSVCIFIGLDWFLFQTGLAATITAFVMGGSWFLILGAFMLVTWFASHTAQHSQSPSRQWLALMAFIGAEALILTPMLYLVYETQGMGILMTACWVTVAIFSALTFYVFQSKKDFSFLRGAIFWASISAVVLILFAALFGLNLGTFFIVGMIALSGMMILYDTSNILRHFPEDRPVAAALHLFSSLAMLLYYVLQFFISQNDDA